MPREAKSMHVLANLQNIGFVSKGVWGFISTTTYRYGDSGVPHRTPSYVHLFGIHLKSWISKVRQGFYLKFITKVRQGCPIVSTNPNAEAESPSA